MRNLYKLITIVFCSILLGQITGCDERRINHFYAPPVVETLGTADILSVDKIQFDKLHYFIRVTVATKNCVPVDSTTTLSVFLNSCEDSNLVRIVIPTDYSVSLTSDNSAVHKYDFYSFRFPMKGAHKYKFTFMSTFENRKHETINVKMDCFSI